MTESLDRFANLLIEGFMLHGFFCCTRWTRVSMQVVLLSAIDFADRSKRMRGRVPEHVKGETVPGYQQLPYREIVDSRDDKGVSSNFYSLNCTITTFHRVGNCNWNLPLFSS